MANPKIQLRHDTSTNWRTQNPVLLEGEVAIETDSNKVKIGNGTDNYNTLPYITDQTKIDLDYSNADYQPVNKSGDTMTGDLRIRKSHPVFKAENTDIKRGQTPLTDYYGNTFMLTDIDGYAMGSLSQIYFASGKHATRLWQRGTNSEVYSVLDVGIDKNDVPYCSFPNTTCCDGQWVGKYLAVESTTYVHGDTTKQFSLSSYLPNDGKTYLVFGSWDGNSADALLQVFLASDVITSDTLICRVATNTNGGSSFVFPVGAGRYIKRRANNHSSSKSTGNCYLTLTGYRRIGTNA